MPDLPRTQSETVGFDEHEAFLCACKGEPYTYEEWRMQVARLRLELQDAEERMTRAHDHGVCLPGRFE